MGRVGQLVEALVLDLYPLVQTGIYHIFCGILLDSFALLEAGRSIKQLEEEKGGKIL
jgi:hypothetical protein